MNIHVIQIYRYDLPLARPLPIGGSRSLANRSGLILELIDDSGSVGLGEIAPLPGSSRETLEEAEQAAIFLAERIRGAEIPLGLETMTSGFEDWIGELGLPPSVRCGFEAAVLGLIALQQGVPLERLLCDEPLRAIAINGLLSGTAEEVLASAFALAQRNYPAMKLKVGSRPLAEDIDLVKKVSHAIPPGVALRLDANRAWNYDTAIAFAAGIQDCAIEYIEEPINDPTELGAFMEETDLPVALDESLVEAPELITSTDPWLDAVVLKPTFLGGFENTIKLARLAIDLGITPVISAAFESGVGLCALAALAAAVDLHGDTAMGLDTQDWFAETLLRSRLVVLDGHLSLRQVGDAGQSVDWKKLTEVYRV